MIRNDDWRDTIEIVRDEAEDIKSETWNAYMDARDKGYEFSDNIAEQYTDLEMFIDSLNEALELLEKRRKKA